jgi:hypothetical protein
MGEQTFPQLEDAVVEWEEIVQGLTGEGTSAGRSVMRAKAGSFQGLIRCSNPACHGGGFEVERVLDEMVQKEEEAREGLLVCPGWIGDADRLPCVNSITYTIHVKYKVRTPPERPSG